MPSTYAGGGRAAAAAASAALGAALLVGLVLSSLPAYGSPTGPAGPTGPTGPNPTATPTPVTSEPTAPTPTPTPTASPTTTTTGPPLPVDLLRPDLITLPAWAPSIQRRGPGPGARVLRFTSALGNIGAGPIEVRPNDNRPCAAGQRNSTQVVYRDRDGNARYDAGTDRGLVRHRAGCMVFHPFHQHWHFRAAARYTLLEPAGAPGPPTRVVMSVRRKVSFCLRDTARVPRTRYAGPLRASGYGACDRSTHQGITSGWMDVYQSFLAGQSLTLPPGLPGGLYCLETVVDPLDQLIESDDTNNRSVRGLVIRGDRVALRTTTRCRIPRGVS